MNAQIKEPSEEIFLLTVRNQGRIIIGGAFAHFCGTGPDKCHSIFVTNVIILKSKNLDYLPKA